MHRKGTRLIGSLPAGSRLWKAPQAMQEKGVLWIAAHPDHPPQIVTPWGIKPLVLVPEPEPPRSTAASHSISTGTKREAP